MGYIYKIINDINNKIYVGQTKRTLEKRWQEHIRYAQEKDSRTKFYKAIQEIGVEHFKIISIEEIFGIEERNNREKYWIQYYDSFNNGYNSTRGGGCFEWNGASKKEVCDKIIELRLEGASYTEITEAVHCGRQLISNVLKSANLVGKNCRSIRKNEAILEMLEQGNYINDIIKELKCDRLVVKKIISQHPELEEKYYNYCHPLDAQIAKLRWEEHKKPGIIAKELGCCDETVFKALDRTKRRQLITKNKQ